MKCDNCFFCTHIGKGIVGEYPAKYCKYYNKYFFPFVQTQDNGGTFRPLDFNNMNDCKRWSNVGCNIHPARVKKAKEDLFKRIENEEGDAE